MKKKKDLLNKTINFMKNKHFSTGIQKTLDITHTIHSIHTLSLVWLTNLYQMTANLNHNNVDIKIAQQENPQGSRLERYKLCSEAFILALNLFP